MNFSLWLRTLTPCAVLIATLCPRGASGEESRVGFGIKAGTTGFGGDVTLRLAPSLNLRAGYAAARFAFDPDLGSSGEDDLRIRINLRSVPLLVDWHPNHVRFRLSAGMALNENRIRMRAYPGDTVRFNDIDYGVEEARGTVDFNRFNPYLGVGYGNAVHPESRWNLVLDLGVMFHGKPKIDFRATASDHRLQPLLDRDVKAEVDDIRSVTDNLRIYPVLALGVSTRF